MHQVEEEQMMLFSHLGNPAQMPEVVGVGETTARRRRKKVKGEETGEVPKKRRLSAEQVRFLEMNFGSEHKLECARKDRLATEIGLDPRQVVVWFQNRRVKWKSKQLQEEYMKLKTLHESVVVEKCMLVDEVLKLREQLSRAEREIRKLSESYYYRISEGERSCSSSSSLDMIATQPFLGDLGEDFFYAPECTYYYTNGMDGWTDLYGP